MSTLIRTSTSEGYTEALGRGLAMLLRSGDVVRLEGDLGAGKTTLVRAIGAALGAEAGVVSSPTYVIVNQYPLRGEAGAARGLEEIVHVDAYRLKTAEDLDSVGWESLVEPGGRARAGSVMLVEWPGRIEGALAAGRGSGVVRLRAVGEGSRRIEIEPAEGWEGRPEWAMLAEREPKRCPVTGEWVEPTRGSYPFANERARMADLGRWFGGGYRISREARPDELE